MAGNCREKAVFDFVGYPFDSGDHNILWLDGPRTEMAWIPWPVWRPNSGCSVLASNRPNHNA